MTVPAISVTGLSFRIDGSLLLNDVSLTVERGAFHAIIGPNGAGKSTLLRCLNGILTDWDGSVSIYGAPLRQLRQREIARRMSYVPQTSERFLSYSVREFVTMSRYAHNRSFRRDEASDRRAVEWALDLVDVGRLADRLLPELSGGERQKVLIAGAFAQNAFGDDPGIMLLDEPTTFLDQRHQREINAVLHRANREHGTTIVAVTHDINSAAITADSVTALKNGGVVFEGGVEDLMCHETLERVFDTPFVLVTHPHTGCPMVVPEAVHATATVGTAQL